MGTSLDIYRRLVWVHIRSQMQYRASFLINLAAAGLISLFEFGTIALVLERFDEIRGWTIGEVAFLFGSVEIAFGIMDMIFSGFDPTYFGRNVRRGAFDQLLLRPVNITLQVLGSDLALRRMGRVLLGMTIFGISIGLTNIQWTPLKVAFLPVIILSMVCFFAGLFIIGATITFWTIESIEAMNIFTYGSSFTISYPMHIYQDWLRRFFTFILPAIFLNYYPALYYLGKPDPFNFPSFAPFLSPFVGIGVLAVGLLFWHFGIRYYQSTGT